VVVDDAGSALALVAAGERVVLVVTPDAPAVLDPGGPGRLAVMVGDPADPAVRAAARAMDAELFAAP
jgi:hypothetical protein